MFFARPKVKARLHVFFFARPKVKARLHILAWPKVQARLQFLKICKKYQALYKQHHYSPSTILTSNPWRLKLSQIQVKFLHVSMDQRI